MGSAKLKVPTETLFFTKCPYRLSSMIYLSFWLDSQFQNIRDEFNMTVGSERKLPSDWPGKQNLKDLTKMAVPLFIFATLVCRFVGDRRCSSPLIQLRKVMSREARAMGLSLIVPMDQFCAHRSSTSRGMPKMELSKTLALLSGVLSLLQVLCQLRRYPNCSVCRLRW